METDVQLIQLVEKFPYLYLSSDPKSKDTASIAKAWKIIDEEIAAEEGECERRWKVLRNRYSKERAKSRRSKGPLRKEWALLRYLSFLNPVVRTRKRIGFLTQKSKVTTSTEDVTMDDDDSIQEVFVKENSYDFTVEQPPCSFPKINSTSDMSFVQCQMDESNANTVDMSLRNFCDSLYSDLKLVPRENLLRCKIEIMQLIEKYQKNASS